MSDLCKPPSKNTEQERQLEQELQAWTKVDQMQARHIRVLDMPLLWCDQLLGALRTRNFAVIKHAFEQVYVGPFKEKAQLLQCWKSYAAADLSLITQDIMSWMERLNQERNTLVLSRVNPPPGTAASSAVLNAFSSTVHTYE